MILPSNRLPRHDLKTQWKHIRRMLGFLNYVKLPTTVTIAFFVLYTFTEVAAVYLLKPAVDLVQQMAVATDADQIASTWEWLRTPGSIGEQLFYALLWLGLMRLAMGVVIYFRSISANWQNMNMVFHMRAQVYDRLQRVGFAFHDQYSTGQVINRALTDLNAVRNFINLLTHAGIDIFFSIVGYVLMMWYCSPWMACAAFIPLPFWVYVIRKNMMLAQPIYSSQREAADSLIRHLTEAIAGVHVIRAFATEGREERTFKEHCNLLLQRTFKGIRLQQLMMPLLHGIAAFSSIGIFAFGAYFVQQEALKIGDLVIFGVAMNVILAKIRQINDIADAYQKAVVSSERTFEILDSADTTPQQQNAQQLKAGLGAVRFSGVTFGYESDKPVLQDITFHVPAGSRVALVGPTGAGKSTLAALLGRFYDPDLGQIAIDGMDIRDATIESVRRVVGFVFQENYLFNDTIARNIAYADRHATREMIENAARAAAAEEFILGLERGYDSVVGEYGASLSGGQRQRLALARAILYNPRILVLDDALSAVDAKTENQIREALDNLRKDRTVFMITSRISTARDADLILVLENGRIVQKGTHDTLLKQPGYYRSVATSQFADMEPSSEHADSHFQRIARATRRSGRDASSRERYEDD